MASLISRIAIGAIGTTVISNSGILNSLPVVGPALQKTTNSLGTGVKKTISNTTSSVSSLFSSPIILMGIGLTVLYLVKSKS